MKKTTKKVFARILSLALVMALMLTSIMSSLVFTASAEGTSINKNVFGYEDGVIPEDHTHQSSFAVAAAPAEGHGDYSLKHSFTSSYQTYTFPMQFVAGNTYSLSGYYYYSAENAETTGYSRWSKFDFEGAELISFTGAEGQWRRFNKTFTATVDSSGITYTAGKCDIYFDDVYIVDLSLNSGAVYVDTDFSDLYTLDKLPLVAGSQASVTYANDETEGTYAVVSLANSLDSANCNVWVPYKLTANVKYRFEMRYKMSAWGCPDLGDGINASNGISASDTWTSYTKTFTPSKDADFLRIGTNSNDVTLCVSSIKLVEYCDVAVATAENGTATVSATEAPANTTVTYTATANAGYVLDYWADAKGNKVSESATYVHTVTEDTTLTPVFAKNENTSAYQSYDFDKVSPALVAPSTTEYTTDKDGNVTNALKVTTSATNNSNVQNILKLDAALESGKSYKLSYDYIGAGYLLPYMGINGDIWNTRLMLENPNYINLSSEVWTSRSVVFTADKALDALNFASIGNENYAGTLYIDNIAIVEIEVVTNTSDKQVYDIDVNKLTVAFGDAFAVEEIEGVNGTTEKVVSITTPTNSTNIDYYIKLDAALVSGNTYKLSFDYKGASVLRIFANNCGWSPNQVITKNSPITEVASKDNENHGLSSDEWNYYAVTFTADDSWTGMLFLSQLLTNFSDYAGKKLYIDNITIEKISSVAVGASENGIGKVSASGAFSGETVTFKALSTVGYSFEKWVDAEGNAVSTDATYVHTVTGDITLTPVFVESNDNKRVVDFEDGNIADFDVIGAKFKVVDDNGNYSLYRTYSDSGVAYIDFYTMQMTAGRTYSISYDYYIVTPNDDETYSTWHNLSAIFESGSKEITSKTPSNYGEWRTVTITYTPSSDVSYVRLNSQTSNMYFDNFTIVDVTNKLSNTENYSEDFSVTDETTLLQSGMSTIDYALDEELGKNIAVVNFIGTSAGNYGWVKVPYYMQNGVQYRVKMTYKSTTWVAPYINGAIDGNQGANTTSEWTNAYWYITGSGDTDYFAFGTAETSTVQIAEIEIEELTLIEGDINNDGEVLANDLVLLTKYLLDVKDEEIFAGKKNDTTVYSTGNADIKEDGKVDILDFIRLKKTVSGTVTLTDDASDVNAVAYKAENVALSTTSADLLEDESSFKVAVSGEDAYIVYKLSGGITEAAVEYDIGVNFMGDFSFEVSDNGKIWTEVTAQDISKEEINSNSWVRVTEYFGGLGNASYFRITFPETVADAGTVCHVRTVKINGLTADALYDLKGYNSLLREPETVYVSNSGDDNNSGLSENAPLKTLSAAFGRMLVPGDKILLESGSTFEGEVKILSSGTEAAPIVIGAYGEVDKPIITGFETAIKVTGEYVEIDGLAFTDMDAYSAVDFYALKEGATKGVGVTNCDFYEINTVADGGSHDRSSGGVHFLAKGNKPTWFDGVTVSDNKFNRLGRNAIYVSSDWAARDTTQEWGIKNFNLDGSPVYLSKNVIIENNYIENNSGDAITVIGTDGALIEYNTVANSALLYNNVYESTGNNIAWAAIWCHSSDNCVMQYNEVYGNRADNYGQDLQAFDIDLACNNCIIQYNYSHDNDGGFLLLCGEDSANNAGVSGAIVRYNLSVNDAASGYNVIDITGSVADSQIYNNTIYCDYDSSSILDYKTITLVNFANYQKVTVKSSNTVFTNNIFYVEDDSRIITKFGYGDSNTTPAFQNATFNNNVLYNVDTTPAYENLITVTNTVTTAPVFVNAGAEETGLQNGENYKVTNIDELVGVVIENNGGKDYLGNTVSADSTLIGAIS